MVEEVQKSNVVNQVAFVMRSNPAVASAHAAINKVLLVALMLFVGNCYTQATSCQKKQ